MHSSLKRRSLVFLSMLVLAVVAASAYNIKGIVKDVSDEPLVGASVRLLTVRDSVQKGSTVVEPDGAFIFRNVQNGRYILEVSFIGYTPSLQNITVSSKNINLRTITLAENAMVLKEAVVTGVRTPVKVMEDTVEYNAEAYKTQPNAVVEDLLKRLPGVEVGSDGAITANGKTVTKILVDGKEFFADDPKVASKNLPVNMIDKLQVVDRKSDLARITGVDDGEEETVINLTVKKGMKNGWFGTVEGGLGTDSRYMASFNVNRFWNDNQVTVLGGLNNVNQPISSDGGGRFRRFGGGNGITLSHALGVNFNVGNGEIFRVGGNVLFNRTSQRSSTRQDRQYLFTDSTSYLNSRRFSHDKGNNLRADFRIQWKPDSFNTLEVRPRMSYNTNTSLSNDSSLTSDGNLARVTESVNRVNADGNSWEFGAEFIYNHNFRNRRGRSFSVQGRFNSSNVHQNENTWSWNRFYLLNDSIDLYDQESLDHTWSNNAGARLSWTEPLGDARNGNFLTLAYNFTYRWNNADKMTYDHPVTWLRDDAADSNIRDMGDGWLGNYVIGDSLIWREDLSNQFRNDYMSQDIRVGFRRVTKTGNLNVGFSVVPQMSKSIDLIDSRRNIRRNVVNFAPFLRYRLRLSKSRSLNLNYRSRTSQPSMTQLQPVADMSNPLRVVVGNPNLDPAFTHSVSLRFQDFNADAQRSIMAMIDGQVVQNQIVSNTTFNKETGGQITTYENVNGAWNVMAMAMYSAPFRNREFNYSMNLFGRYNRSIAFNAGQRVSSGDFNLNLMPGLTWRPDYLEFELRPRYSLQLTKSGIASQSDRTVHSYGGMFNATYNAPFGLSVSTDLNYSATSGYSQGYDSKQCLWNATIAYSFLKNRSLVLSVKAYDLLQQRSNIRRNVSANYIDDTLYNSLSRYFMVTVAWKFNTFGKGNEPASRGGRFGGHRGPGGPGGGPGGPR